MAELQIREIVEDRGQICLDILHSLPQWFGIESAIQKYAVDVEAMPTFVAYAENAPIGILSLQLHNEWTAEIHVMAIRSEFHRKGIGRSLLTACESYLRHREYEFLSVKTISASSDSKEYGATRKFYFATGFRPVEELGELWGKNNPCLLMTKAL
jgi:ribosomal protein S18 acetylase RimI-like enzyme